MLKAEYGFNLDEDARKIADAIADIDQRLDNLQTNDEQDADEDNDRKLLWPSLSDR